MSYGIETEEKMNKVIWWVIGLSVFFCAKLLVPILLHQYNLWSRDRAFDREMSSDINAKPMVDELRKHFSAIIPLRQLRLAVV